MTDIATDTRRAYVAGWQACMTGEDGRYTNPYTDPSARYAWDHGFLNAMEAEDGETP
jgi:ribosome modulation factor